MSQGRHAPTALTPQPARTQLTPRAAEIVQAARELLEEQGPEALTMRALGERLGMRAPSIYKHLKGKEAVEAALIEQGLAEMGAALYAALDGAGDPVEAVLRAYRRMALAHPNLYRLSTGGPLNRAALPEGLEEWAGTPFFLACGEPQLAQALWSFAHGMVILELDGRFPDSSALDLTWREGARAFLAARTAP
ncbi:TetR/AcrR family transcriptional regulator [Bailinhaonella thermotolerans]|uniref:TetR/AcrR family transcriptional regulator n=1 Tax=Bailinhaonella thermotolerans TaxID=1070861 RepID=A0A3A4AVV1_9ACTN|nr:TetR/AcrR family transcriptional regulator [Bailinhaonella thermotolerans]RJL33975.1 TetR/AcrR family transcriptional regulator [Bailinhaonella thermotolerans]